ncbi:hypothetical protein AVEN_272066-1 [Araneus ventricosus]|uniref:Uncharacterized protein n=1 Tax=Araneus ventricosus TaxID=182803 RepID=A0A4Y2QLR7_ARAVE|nr:hypothetical protein AVEN_272066-1 [Araneus ventricosus]
MNSRREMKQRSLAPEFAQILEEGYASIDNCSVYPPAIIMIYLLGVNLNSSILATNTTKYHHHGYHQIPCVASCLTSDHLVRAMRSITLSRPYS